MVPIPKLNDLQVCHFVAHAHSMKNGARKILEAEKFQVKMLLYLFISQLQIPDLISVLFHNNYLVTGVSVYLKNKFPRDCCQFNQKFLEWVHKRNIWIYLI